MNHATPKNEDRVRGSYGPTHISESVRPLVFRVSVRPGKRVVASLPGRSIGPDRVSRRYLWRPRPAFPACRSPSYSVPTPNHPRFRCVVTRRRTILDVGDPIMCSSDAQASWPARPWRSVQAMNLCSQNSHYPTAHGPGGHLQASCHHRRLVLSRRLQGCPPGPSANIRVRSKSSPPARRARLGGSPHPQPPPTPAVIL